jgi:hypothetical protein
MKVFMIIYNILLKLLFCQDMYSDIVMRLFYGYISYLEASEGRGQMHNGSIQQEKVICLECRKALQLLSHGIWPRMD